jgi:SAM-dependent methyltransferase
MKPHFDFSACSTLRLAEDGIYYAGQAGKISYPEEGNEACFEVEDRSFWFRHRNACIIEMVRNFPPRGNGPIFDVGGGNGFVAKGLMDAGWDVVLVEPGPAGARNAKKRGLPHVICATTQSAGFQAGTLPAIGVFDVVEHIQDDGSFVGHLHDLLEQDGMLYLTVPAFQFLWSAADVRAGHARRYTLQSLWAVLEENRFSISYATYFFKYLPATVFLFRTLPYLLGCSNAKPNKKKTAREHGTKEGAAVKMMRRLLSSEKSLISFKKTIPFGGSCIVAAQKKRNEI